MFSIKELNDDSRTVALIRDLEKKKIKHVIWFTDKSRRLRNDQDTFERDTEQLFEKDKHGYLVLKNQDRYQIEIVPHSRVTEKFPRLMNFYIAPSNSGKSYNMAGLCKQYLNMFPDNKIKYVSANPIDNDKNYKDIINEIVSERPVEWTEPVDFTDIRDELWIFDDCDAGFSVSMEDIGLTEEAYDELTITDRSKADRIRKNKSENALGFVNETMKSLAYNARKNNISQCVVNHKFNPRGGNQTILLSECTGVVLFPYNSKKGVLETFLVEKLDMDKDDAKVIRNLPWVQYDFLFINNLGKPFIFTPDRIKIFD